MRRCGEQENENTTAHKVARRVSGRRLQVLNGLFTLRQYGTSDNISTCTGLRTFSVNSMLQKRKENVYQL